MKKVKKICSISAIIFFINLFIFSTLASTEINIKNNEFEIDISYEYNNENNTVKVKAKSNRELVQKTLPGWILGEDKISYTAIYDTNQVFSTYFTDTYGNKVLKEIKIDKIDDKGPLVEVKYLYNEKNNTVTVTVNSNEQMKVKRLAGWILSEDKISYTAMYDTNQVFSTYFTDIHGNQTLKEIKIDQINDKGSPNVDISYEYNNENNTVTVKAKANRKLVQKTLSGWILGEDKKSYTAVYDRNQVFSTYFTDIYGNKVLKEIKIDQIDEAAPVVEVKYSYNEKNNTVKVAVNSNEQMKVKRLAGWILSEDKTSYTAIYDRNQVFSTYFTDIYGNQTLKEIKIDQINDKGSPNVDISYEYNNENNTVTVKAKANRKLVQKTLSGWILGEDKISYTAIYDTNQVFSTYFTDIYGNKVLKEIRIDQIDDTGPVVEVKYSFDAIQSTCIVTVQSDEEMKVKRLEGWVLSEDKMSYTARYNINQMFYTNFTDRWGNVTTIPIKVQFNIGIDVSKHNGEIEWQKVKDSGIAFAIIRGGYGRDSGQEDIQFQKNYVKAKECGMPIGVYWYSYAQNVEQAKLEAYNCLKTISGKSFELPIFFDIEDPSQEHIDKQTQTDMALEFCKIIKNAGFKNVGIYTGKYWLQNYIDIKRIPDEYALWIASYGSNSGEPERNYEYKGRHELWQYTSVGTVPGIKGDVDMNLCYKKYW